ncbi:MAG: ATP-binding protein [Coriobacteriales bacterium]|nr:ATP-binding protein [Coriobacteriales bacterium]
MDEITLEAEDSNLEELLGFISQRFEGIDYSERTKMQIDVSVEEAFANIVRYAYTPGTGSVTLRVQIEKNDTVQPELCITTGSEADSSKNAECPVAIITLIDQGIPYNPLKKSDPDVTLTAEERKIGGLGIFLIKKNMDAIDYAYENGCNVLTLRKKLV